MKLSTPLLFRKLQKRSLALLVGFLFSSVTIFAQPVDFVILDQPAGPVTVGNSFTVRVALDFIGATPPLGVDALEVHLGFDNTKLQVTAMSLLPPVSGFGAVAIPLEGSPFTNTNATGEVAFAAGTLGVPPTTDLDIMSVTFLVTGGAGTTTPLDFLEILAPPIFQLTDAQRIGTSIKNSAIDATITINAVACTLPVVNITGNASCNGGPITLNLASSSAGTGPFDLTINGTQYNNISVGNNILPTPYTVPTQSVFPGNPVPAIPTNNDIGFDPLAATIEVGMKFYATEDGFIRGVRFYNGADNSGTYTGKLYTEAGVQLAAVIFTGVTTNGWQEALFTHPVAITANTTYVVTYLSVGGYYAATAGGFNNDVVSGSLVGQQSNPGVDENGLYLYGGGFPTNSFGNTDYSVDVVFSPASVTFNLTSVTDDLGCTNTGAPNLQSLTVTSIACATLPVTLMNFSATTRDNNVTLRWSTSSEINNRGFEVLRSATGTGNWESIAFVNGAGNSTSTKNYTYLDANLPAKRYYYQLKQVDIDNRTKFSAVVSALINGKLAFSLEQNFPNPFRSETTNIRFTLPQRERVNLSIFDVNGRLIKVLVDGTKEEGTHVIPFQAGSLGTGVYYYKIQAGEFSSVKKMTIQ